MDEDVIIEGSELHKYLKEQGYTDFETVDNFYTSKNQPISNKVEISEELFEDCIEEHFHTQIEAILKSSLLFSDDAEAVELLRTNDILNSKLSLGKSVLLSVLAAVAGSGVIISYRHSQGLWLIPTSIASCGLFLYTGHLTWQFYNRIKSQRLLSEHISLLKRICGTIQKLLRFLRETEVISTGKLLTSSLGSVAYVGSRLWERNPQSLPHWKTLPELRKFVSDTLVSLAVTISCSTDSIKEVLPSLNFLKSTIPEECSSKILIYQVLGMKVNILQDCIALSELHKLNEMYLLVQSDYLKNLCWCFCPRLWLNKSSSHLSKIYSKIILANQASLYEIYNQLQLQYKIFVSSPTSKSNTTLMKKPSVNYVNICNEMHNISLQLYSLIHQIREFEDILEDELEHFAMLHAFQNHCHMLNCFENAFQQIKQSLIKSEQISKKCLNIPSRDQSGSVNELISNSINELKVRETNIQLGVSDFEIKTDDVDVYIGECDRDSEQFEPQQSFNDFEYQNNPNLCHNVLKELKLNLESRKKLYSEKEKISLEKKGLSDIDCSNDFSTPVQSRFNRNNMTEISRSCDSLKKCDKSRQSNKRLNPLHKKGRYSNENLNSIEQSDNNSVPNIELSNSPPSPPAMNVHSEINFSSEVASISRTWGLASEEEMFTD